MLTFDEYRQNEPESSEHWATSDRGWAWDSRHPRGEAPCFAHYLRYDHGAHYDKGDRKNVHVCIVGRGVVWVRSCSDARLAIRAAFRQQQRQDKRSIPRAKRRDGQRYAQWVRDE